MSGAATLGGEALDVMAHTLAYESSCSILDSTCVRMGESLGCTEWLKIPAGAAEAALVADPIAYLDARGLIERHPHMPHWIALLDESEASR